VSFRGDDNLELTRHLQAAIRKSPFELDHHGWVIEHGKTYTPSWAPVEATCRGRLVDRGRMPICGGALIAMFDCGDIEVVDPDRLVIDFDDVGNVERLRLAAEKLLGEPVWACIVAGAKGYKAQTPQGKDPLGVIKQTPVDVYMDLIEQAVRGGRR
jgi:hypothetical protein